MSARPTISTSRIIRLMVILLIALPLLMVEGQEVHAQKKKRASSKREVVRKIDRRHHVSRSTKGKRPEAPRMVSKLVTPPDQPLPEVTVEPFADLAAEVLRDITSPAGAARRASFSPDDPLSPAQLALISRYNREESRIPPRPYAAVADHFGTSAPIFVEGHVGLFTTADIRAGMTGRSWPFDYVLRFNAGSTNGSVDHATRRAIGFEASGGYVINDDAWIFSGGHMGGEVEYGRAEYALYSLAAHPLRTVETWSVGMSGANVYLDDEFSLHGSYRGLTLNDDDGAEVMEHALGGHASFGTPWMGLILGGDATLSLPTVSGTSMPYTRIAAGATLRRSTVILHAGGALSFGQHLDGSTSTRLAPVARLTLTPSSGFSLAAELTGGVQQWNGHQVLQANPWSLSGSRLNARHEDQIIGYSGELRLDPSESFVLHLTASRGLFASYLGYGAPENGRFTPQYEATTVDQITGETVLELDANNRFSGIVRFAESTRDGSGARLPFSPRWFVEATHSARIAPLPLTFIVGARYIGDRLDGSGSTMDPVVILTIEGRYRLSSLLEATATITNILDTRYQLWQGYEERGAFAALGLALRL